MKKLIYIASPYTNGDQAANVRLQMGAANAIFNMGAIPYAPLLNHFSEIFYPRKYEEYMDMAKTIVPKCDALLRIGGASNGATFELGVACENKVPVLTKLGTLEEWLKKQESGKT